MTEYTGDSMWWQKGVEASSQPRGSGDSSGGPARAGAPAASAAPAAASLTAVSHIAQDGTAKSDASSRRPSGQAPAKASAASKPPKKAQQPWFEFLPLQASVKPTLRPKFPPSRKNLGTADAQAAREAAAAEARAQRSRQQAASLRSHPHHAPLQLGPQGAIPQQHIVQGDKGRHRPEWCRSGTIFDPITSTSRPVTAPGRAEACAGVLSPVKHSSSGSSSTLLGSNSSKGLGASLAWQGSDLHASSDSGAPATSLFYAGSAYNTATGELLLLQRRPGSAPRPDRGGQGRYNPVTHTWLEPPSPQQLAEQQRASERAEGFGSRRRGSSVSGGSGHGGSGAGGGGGETVARLLRQDSRDAGGLGGTTGDGRPASAPGGGRRPLRCGPTWGTYDVLRNRWIVPPTDARVVSSEVKPSGLGVDRLAATAEGLAPVLRVSPKAAQGRYNPISCEWTVLPASARAARTLDFAPRLLFQEKAFVKR